ncbi:metallo-beta-lactamase superfamily protein [Aspergillus heteromorphus CBS 117.55]|uniref:Metallo-beta-lactamase superfamily protein n=1 Tax=Aspergillus heteromorphus CBS 117.55 TaxID=1448321 RepID=A0A317X2D0_9EURO|nr:metallo-beta-lactamase superfamily protein [Aspergillus heteromorphus CBS 117.55]PWY92794.1 metallo-beta-lactamase superfamily protein [Aspergillus heteromorphus CBS 117.55]
MASTLLEIDSLEATIIIDNELDTMSPVAPDTVQVTGQMRSLATDSPHLIHDRGDARRELQMEDICCAAHGLSILVTATKDGERHTLLFDAGPEGEAWERNVKRLRPDLSAVELVQLSHWHRDHSGGLQRAIQMITSARQSTSNSHGDGHGPIVDVHPDRPDYRGMAIGENIISLQADPTFAELKEAGGVVEKHDDGHTVLDDFFFVSGEIPRRTGYEMGLRGGMRFDKDEGDWFSDEGIADERFLMCNLKGKGIVMFTACSHAGVVNCARHAIDELGGDVPLHAIIGGFHLATSDAAQLESTVRDLKRLDPAVILPGHCSGWRAKFAIERSMPGALVPCSVGMKITF